MSVGTLGPIMSGVGNADRDAECRAALIACGIDPDELKPYSELSSSISDERNEYRKKRIERAKSGRPEDAHEPHCGYPSATKKTQGKCTCYESANPAVIKEMGRREWLKANSEAGHILKDELVRRKQKHSDLTGERAKKYGSRGDVCANAIPGYDEKKSFTLLHHGDASTHGMHRVVTHSTEPATMDELGKRGPNVKPADQEYAARQNAAATVQNKANRSRDADTYEGDVSSKSKQAQANKTRRKGVCWAIDSERRKLAGQLKAEAAQPGNSTAADAIQANLKSAADGGGPTPQAEKTARDCIVEKAMQNLVDMQTDAVNESSTVAKEYNEANAPKKFSDLSPEEQRKVVEANKKRLEDRNTELELRHKQRQKRLEAIDGKLNARGTSTEDRKALEKERGGLEDGRTAGCKEYQANRLAVDRDTVPPVGRMKRYDGSVAPSQSTRDGGRGTGRRMPGVTRSG